MKTKILSVIYFLVGFLFILLHNHLSPVTDLILKGLIIPVLMWIFLINMPKGHTLINILISGGLIFSRVTAISIYLFFYVS